ncbi:MAG: FAD-dependent oxidoreductase, partial [Chitinophagaceae bacterium]
MENYDVIVIGAGAAGLIAALELALAGKKVCVLEAKDRCGGRMHTINAENNTAVELGAEFVHGNLPITKELLRKAGGSLYEVKGRIWQKHEGHLQEQGDFIGDYDELEEKFKELEQDISVKDFLENCLSGEKYEALRFTLQNYVEGYYAADIA